MILATGYEPAPLPVPHDLLALDAAGRPVVELDYRLRLADGSPSTLFVQNAELHTHGVGTPDLGLGAHRNAVIANALAGREVYAVRERNVFQSFGARCRPRSRGRRERGAGGRRRATTRAIWERANRELIAKLLTELEFEELLRPESRARSGRWRSAARWRCTTARGGGRSATRASTRRRCGRPATASTCRCPTPPRSSRVGAPALGVDPATTAGLVGEIASTLLSDVHQLEHGRPARELVDLDPLELEGEMRGHPWIVASKGRVGFSADDLARYAPEAGKPVPLLWLRGRGRGHARARRTRCCGRRSASPATRRSSPCTRGSGRTGSSRCSRATIARGRIRLLGELGGRYLPQQSIRTLADADHPERRHLKLALSILNTSASTAACRATARSPRRR